MDQKSVENLKIVDFAVIPGHSFNLLSMLAITNVGNEDPLNTLLHGFTV